MTFVTFVHQKIQKIAILDDDVSEAKMAELEVEAAGFEPLVINGPFQRIEDATDLILTKAQGVLCDHRLAHFGYANFSGAKLVARLYDFKIPAILISQYAGIDGGISIRTWRDKIPILLSRDETDANRIEEGIEYCLQELSGLISSNRKPYRTLLRIVGVNNAPGEKTFETIIPSWNHKKAVIFPASLLPRSIKLAQIKVGTRLFAQVNIGAEKAEDLYFKSFELGMEPDIDDELA